MENGFRSLEEFLHNHSTEVGMDLKNATAKKMRVAVNSVYDDKGVARLLDLSKEIMGEGLPERLKRDGLDRIDIIEELVYQSSQGKTDADEVLRTFLCDINLLSEDAPRYAKKRSPVKNESSPDKDVRAVENRAGSPARPKRESLWQTDDLSEDPFKSEVEAENRVKEDTTAPISSPEKSAEPQIDRVKTPEKSVIVPDVETVEEDIYDPLGDFTDKALYHKWPGSGGSDMSRIASGELMKLPGVLPPPPSGTKGEDFGKWLDGDIWHPLALSLKLDLLDDDNIDDLTEMQSEFYAEPAGAIKTYSARAPSDPEEGRSQSEFLFRAGRDLGRYAFNVHTAAEELSRSVLKYLEEYEPRSAEFLGRIGFEVHCSEKLAVVIASALDIEKFFLEDGPDGSDEGSMHDIRGSLSPDSRLDNTHVLDRAILMHFTVGVPLAKGMTDALIELRHAQVSRDAGHFVVSTDFDEAFSKDWFIELDEYEFANEETPAPM
jgi:hypothetical protein